MIKKETSVLKTIPRTAYKVKLNKDGLKKRSYLSRLLLNRVFDEK